MAMGEVTTEAAEGFGDFFGAQGSTIARRGYLQMSCLRGMQRRRSASVKPGLDLNDRVDWLTWLSRMATYLHSPPLLPRV